MSDIAGETSAQLELLKAPVAQWDAVFVHALHARLDEENAAKWEDERDGDDFPPLKKMLDFLDRRATSLRANVVVKQSLKVVINNEQATYKQTPPSVQSSVGPGAQGGKEDWCPVHKAHGHRIYDCKTFLSKNRRERLLSVAEHRLCPNCLKSGVWTR